TVLSVLVLNHSIKYFSDESSLTNRSARGDSLTKFTITWPDSSFIPDVSGKKNKRRPIPCLSQPSGALIRSIFLRPVIRSSSPPDPNVADKYKRCLADENGINVVEGGIIGRINISFQLTYTWHARKWFRKTRQSYFKPSIPG